MQSACEKRTITHDGNSGFTFKTALARARKFRARFVSRILGDTHTTVRPGFGDRHFVGVPVVQSQLRVGTAHGRNDDDIHFIESTFEASDREVYDSFRQGQLTTFARSTRRQFMKEFNRRFFDEIVDRQNEGAFTEILPHFHLGIARSIQCDDLELILSSLGLYADSKEISVVRGWTYENSPFESEMLDLVSEYSTTREIFSEFFLGRRTADLFRFCQAFARIGNRWEVNIVERLKQANGERQGMPKSP